MEGWGKILGGRLGYRLGWKVGVQVGVEGWGTGWGTGGRWVWRYGWRWGVWLVGGGLGWGCRDTEVVNGDWGVEIQRWWMEMGV